MKIYRKMNKKEFKKYLAGKNVKSKKCGTIDDINHHNKIIKMTKKEKEKIDKKIKKSRKNKKFLRDFAYRYNIGYNDRGYYTRKEVEVCDH